MTEPVKLAAYVPLSAEVFDDYANMQAQIQAAMRRTPAERSAVEAERKAKDAKRLAEAQAEHAAGARARAKVDGKLAEVLDLHRPVLSESALWVECGGCEYGGYDAEPPEWPCTTWALIADDTR